MIKVSRLGLFFLACILFGITTSTLVYADNLKEYTKVWTNAPISGSISQNKKWKYYLEPQIRFVDDAYKFNQANLFAGIYYQATPVLSFWLGVFRQYAINTDGQTTQQYRLWQQMVWRIASNDKIDLASRSRLEERKNFANSQIAYRIRERLTLKLPMSAGSHYFIVLADEVFLQLNQPVWVADRVFAENRAALGIEIPVNKCVSYEIGYLNQFQFDKTDQMSNVLYFTLNLNLD